jgi:leader peptidase (prepilin peptidase)/N-methyltransferase
MEPLLERLEPVLLVWVTLVGACVGSFLNVAIFRLPRRCLSVLRPARSFCPLCRHAIRWYENIPMVSWLALRARCSGCQAPIHWRYPLVELVTTVLWAWLAWRDLAGRVDSLEAWGVFAVHATFVSGLLVCTLIDWEFRIIPDEVDVPGILLTPLAVAAFPALLDHPPFTELPDVAGAAGWLHLHLQSAFAWWGVEGVLGPLETLARLPSSAPGGYPHLQGFAGAALGAAAGAGFIFLTGEGFGRMLGKEAMGFGDVKYMGMIGALTGWQGVVTTILIACLAGSLGGIAYMFYSGRSRITGRDLEAWEDLTPLGQMALRLTGAPRGVPVAADEVVPIRPGTGFLARFATGDPYVPFGPFLSVGAFVAAFWPGAVQRAWIAWVS